MADNNQIKQAPKWAINLFLTFMGLCVLTIIVLLIIPSSPDLKNPKKRLFEPASYLSMRHYVTETVLPTVDGKTFTAEWKDSVLSIKNKVSEAGFSKENDYDAVIRLTSMGANSIGVVISSSFDDPHMADNVYQNFMAGILKHYAKKD